jgi:hypothetical protein
MTHMTPEQYAARHAHKIGLIDAYIEDVADFAQYCMEACHDDAAMVEAMDAKVRTDHAVYEWYRRDGAARTMDSGQRHRHPPVAA